MQFARVMRTAAHAARSTPARAVSVRANWLPAGADGAERHLQFFNGVGGIISPWHEVRLAAHSASGSDSKALADVHGVVMAPRRGKAVLDVAYAQQNNPIVPRISKQGTTVTLAQGAPFVAGILPQTWSPRAGLSDVGSYQGLRGTSTALAFADVTPEPGYSRAVGDVYSLRVVGAAGFNHGGAAVWTILAVQQGSSVEGSQLQAAMYNAQHWLASGHVHAAGKQAAPLADGALLSAEQALELIEAHHGAWRDMAFQVKPAGELFGLQALAKAKPTPWMVPAGAELPLGPAGFTRTPSPDHTAYYRPAAMAEPSPALQSGTEPAVEPLTTTAAKAQARPHMPNFLLLRVANHVHAGDVASALRVLWKVRRPILRTGAVDATVNARAGETAFAAAAVPTTRAPFMEAPAFPADALRAVATSPAAVTALHELAEYVQNPLHHRGVDAAMDRVLDIMEEALQTYKEAVSEHRAEQASAAHADA